MGRRLSVKVKKSNEVADWDQDGPDRPFFLAANYVFSCRKLCIGYL